MHHDLPGCKSAPLVREEKPTANCKRRQTCILRLPRHTHKRQERAHTSSGTRVLTHDTAACHGGRSATACRVPGVGRAARPPRMRARPRTGPCQAPARRRPPPQQRATPSHSPLHPLAPQRPRAPARCSLRQAARGLLQPPAHPAQPRARARAPGTAAAAPRTARRQRRAGRTRRRRARAAAPAAALRRAGAAPGRPPARQARRARALPTGRPAPGLRRGAGHRQCRRVAPAQPVRRPQQAPL